MNAPTTRKGFAPGTIFTVYGWAMQADRKLHAMEMTYRKNDGDGSTKLSTRVTSVTFKTAKAADAWSLAYNTAEGNAKCTMVPINS